MNEKFLEVDGFDPTGLIPAEKIIDEAINGMKNDKFEIYPGLVKVFRFLIRIFPKMIFSQADKIGAKAMAGTVKN